MSAIVVVKPAPAFSSQSNSVENMIGIIEMHFIILRSSTEAKLGMRVAPGTPLYKWMARHAGWCTTHCLVLASGCASFYNMYGHSYTRELVTFGEAILARLPRSKVHRRGRGKLVHKGDMGYARGIWLGKCKRRR